MAAVIRGRVRNRILATVRQYKGAHYVSFTLHSRLSLAVDVRALGPFPNERSALAAAQSALRDPARRARYAARLRADRN